MRFVEQSFRPVLLVAAIAALFVGLSQPVAANNPYYCNVFGPCSEVYFGFCDLTQPPSTCSGIYDPFECGGTF